MANEKYFKSKYNNDTTLFIYETILPNGNAVKFFQHISENGMTEEEFELDRVTIIEITE